MEHYNSRVLNENDFHNNNRIEITAMKKLFFSFSIALLAVMLLIMYPPATSAWLLYALFFLLGAFTAAQTIGYPVIAESNEDKVLGTANGLSAVVLMGMAAVTNPLFGKLIELFGGGAEARDAQVQEAFAKAIWVMPIAFIAAIVCALLLNETFKRES